MSIERTDLVKMGKHLSDLRKSKKLTQMQLAEILDVSNKSVSKWEVGDIAPDITLLVPLADVLGVSVEEILTGGEQIGESKSLNIYKRMTKKRLIKEVIISIIFSISFVFLISAVERYYRWDVKEISGDGEARAHGYIINNNNKLKIIIDKIAIQNELSDIKIDGIEYSLLVDDVEIYRYVRYCDNKHMIECLTPTTILFEDNDYSKDKYNFDNLHLTISYSKDGTLKNFINISLQK